MNALSQLGRTPPPPAGVAPPPRAANSPLAPPLAPPAPEDPALVELRKAQRENILLLIVAAAPVDYTTASSVQMTAEAVAKVAEVPSELTPTAQQAAVQALAAVAATRELVTQQTAEAVARALSNLAKAALLTPESWQLAASGAAAAAAAGSASLSTRRRAQQTQGGVSLSASPLQSIFSVADAVSDSLLASALVPGEPATSVRSDAIQIGVRLDASDRSSRLATSPLAVPGGATSFDPLPLEALSRLSGASGGVRSKLLASSFDPYAESPAEATVNGGIVRLVFQDADSGGEIKVRWCDWRKGSVARNRVRRLATDEYNDRTCSCCCSCCFLRRLPTSPEESPSPSQRRTATRPSQTPRAASSASSGARLRAHTAAPAAQRSRTRRRATTPSHGPPAARRRPRKAF